MSETLSILAIAAFFGFAMKMADLLDEHGLRLFWGDRLLFGLLWGVLGSLLVISDNAVANVVLAMVLAFIVQLRLDYLNHALGAVMVIITFILIQNIEPLTFSVFFLSFVVFGLLRAYVGDVRQVKDAWFRLLEPGWGHYYIVPFFWAIFTGGWIIFFTLAIYRTCYNIAKYGLWWRGVYEKL